MKVYEFNLNINLVYLLVSFKYWLREYYITLTILMNTYISNFIFMLSYKLTLWYFWFQHCKLLLKKFHYT